MLQPNERFNLLSDVPERPTYFRMLVASACESVLRRVKIMKHVGDYELAFVILPSVGTVIYTLVKGMDIWKIHNGI